MTTAQEITDLKAFKDNMHSVILTDMDGVILDYNGIAQEAIFSGKSSNRGKHLTKFLKEDSANRLKELLNRDPNFKQPFFGQGFEMKDSGQNYNLRFYTNPDHCFDLVFFELPETSQEVLLSQEEYRWLERLKLTLFGISHELKTPLATAKGYTELLEGTEEEETGTLILNALDRLGDVLNDMTAPLSNIDEDQNQIELGKTSELFINAATYSEPTKRFVGNINVDLEQAKEKFVSLNKPRLYQIFTNLFENSMRATEDLETDAEISIKARACQKDHHFQCLVIEFSDNGVGMDEKTRENVFAPYFTTRTPDSGTGMGAFFVNQFVVDAGGSIEVDSELGEGTTFYIHLPYKNQEEEN